MKEGREKRSQMRNGWRVEARGDGEVGKEGRERGESWSIIPPASPPRWSCTLVLTVSHDMRNTSSEKLPFACCDAYRL